MTAKLKLGQLVRRTHQRPQNRRHGFLTAIKGKVAWVRFHGSGESRPVLLSKLETK